MNNIFNMLRQSPNPVMFAQSQLRNMANTNPMIASAFNGNVETVVRNICKERGIDVDSLYSQVINKR